MREGGRDIAVLLRERAKKLARREQSDAGVESEPLVIFSIGGQSFGLPLAGVVYAARLQHLTPIPRAASHYLGLTWMGGYLVTVLDAAALLGMRDDRLRDVTTCVIGSCGSRQLGFGAEQIVGIEDVPASQITPLPPSDPQERGAARLAFLGTGRAFLLDLGQLLARLDAGEVVRH